MKFPLSFYKLVMAAAVALPTMALATITPATPQQDTDNCYMIGSAAELYGFAEKVNGTAGGFSGCGKLTANIVVNENVLGTDNANVNASGAYTGDDSNFEKWAPINGFAGKFHGQGHTISGLYFNDPEKENVGLFGSVDGVEIDGLGLVNSYFGGSSKVGGFVGYAGGTVYIRNSYNSSVVRGHSGDWWCGVGGFVGAAEVNELEIENSYNLGFVTGGPAVGGLVGIIWVRVNFSVSNSYNAGDVKGTAEDVGGLVGYVGYLDDGYEIRIVSSYNTGSVCGGKGKEGVGGLVGYLDEWGEIRIVNSYNTGTVDGDDYAGGLVGGDGRGAGYANVYNSYNAGFVNGGKGDALGFCGDVDNFYYLEGSSVGYYTSKSAADFADGTVAEALHGYNGNGVDGSVWGQGFGRDAHPTLTGAIGPALTLHVYEGVEIDSAYTPDTDLPKPTREGYEFLGWYAKSDFSGSAVTRIPSDATDALEYYAKWKALGGSGCIEIASADDLFSFAARVNGGDGEICGKLTDNITVNEGLLDYVDGGTFDLDGYKADHGNVEPKAWTPIGTKGSGTSGKPFKGTFYGNGHTISGLYVNPQEQTKSAYKGLFGYVGGEVVIDGVGIVDSYISGFNYVGGLVGGLAEGTSLTISNSFNAGFVVGNMGIGGLVGGLQQSLPVNNPTTVKINNSYNLGRVAGNTSSIGGLAGYADALAINNSYNMGLVSSKKGSGDDGLVGNYYTLLASTVANCFFTGKSQFEGKGATKKTAEEFANGSVAKALHDWCEKETGSDKCKEGGLDGSIWGQDVLNGDPLPNFSDKITGTLHDLVLHTFEGDSRVYPTKYLEEKGFVLPTDLTREGYIFLGWYKTSYFSGSAVTEIPANATGKLEYYAKWMKFSDNCYEIASAGDLYDFAAIVNGGAGEICGKLMDNISVNENVLTSDGSLNADHKDDFAPWTPIGTFGAQFKGTFDGQGHTISGLYFKDDNANDVGLFGYVGKASIQNVGVVDSYFKGGQHVGGVVGEMSGSITNCYNKGVVSGTKYVGGVLGMLNEGSISNVYNVGSVSGSKLVGGVAGACADEVSVNNAFYNKDAFTEDAIGESCEGNFDNVEGRTASEFANGSVAKALHDWCEMDGDACKKGGLDGSVWGQDLSKENSLPEFIERLDYKMGGMTFFELAGKIDSAYVDAASDIAVNFPNDVVVSGPVKFKRSFPTMGVNNGYSTIMLPFTPKFETDADTIEGVNFYTFSNYEKATISVTPVKQMYLEANTPYLVKAAGAAELVFGKGGTFNTTTGGVSENGYKVELSGTGWTIFGTYEYKKWEEGDEGLGKTYGFVGAGGNDADDVGKFKKAGVGAYIYPMRAYLKYEGELPKGAPRIANNINGAIASLPETINVVIDVAGDASDDRTVIGTISTRTGEFKFATDRWFDLNGRYLGSKKPTQKGAYYNNGKKVIVK